MCLATYGTTIQKSSFNKLSVHYDVLSLKQYNDTYLHRALRIYPARFYLDHVTRYDKVCAYLVLWYHTWPTFSVIDKGSRLDLGITSDAASVASQCYYW
jgi:hypothetical protein